MKATYARFALVAHREHVDKYIDDDGETLLVSSNWLLWQECLAEGRHTVHIDRGLIGWEEAHDLGNTLYIRANDWMFVDGHDATEFRGASLGIKLHGTVSMILCDYEKLNRALETLVEEYRPREIVFHDLLTDYGCLDMTGRWALVNDVANRFGLIATDETDPLADREPGFPIMSQDFSETSLGSRNAFDLRAFGIRAYERVVGGLARLRQLFGRRRPSVLLLVTHLNGIPLLKAFDGKDVYAQYLARWWPNKRNVVNTLRCLKRGILPVDAATPVLSSGNRARLAEIIKTFDIAWTSTEKGATREMRRNVCRALLREPAITDAAREVLWLESILERFRPNVIVTDGLRNFLSNTAFSIGKRWGMTTVAMWHATLSQEHRLTLFGSDPRVPPLVDKCLTWGTVHERWLKAIGAKTQTTRTGSVVSVDLHRNREHRKRRAGGYRTALVLQYALGPADYRTLPTNEYYYFVEVIRMLAELGYREVRVKLHPGIPKERYYRRISEVFGLECEIIRIGGLARHFEWADIAIGPASSGAALEFIEAGVPFFPVLLEPHSRVIFDDQRANIFSDLAALWTAVAGNAPPDLRDFAEGLTSAGTIPDPAERVWAVLRGDIVSTPRPRAQAPDDAYGIDDRQAK